MDLGYRYSACEESIDSSDFESENDSGCSHFYRQTAKVRFTRTTSKVQHHMETRAADEGSRQLFGCLRRSSSTSQMSQYLERNSPAKKGNKFGTNTAGTGVKRSPESEKRQQELEKTRQEIKRMDQQLEQQQPREKDYRRTTNTSSASELPFSASSTIASSPRCQQNNSFSDSWIAQLPSLTESMIGTEERIASPSPSSGRSSCCWDWCLSDQSSSWPPHVDLEPFNGDPSQWPCFIQRFKTWIHDAMPNDQLRMIYLEELLAPDLRHKYSSYFSYPGRYRNLLSQLRNHYGNPLLIVRACFDALRQLAPLDYMNNSKSSLGDFSGKVQQVVATLKMVGCEQETRTFSSLELSGLVSKLTENLRDNWNHHIKERQSLVPLPNLDEFANWLQDKIAEPRRR